MQKGLFEMLLSINMMLQLLSVTESLSLTEYQSLINAAVLSPTGI